MIYTVLSIGVIIQEFFTGVKREMRGIIILQSCVKYATMCIARSTAGAFKQINPRQYPEAERDYAGEIPLVGIDYDKDIVAYVRDREMVEMSEVIGAITYGQNSFIPRIS